MYVRIDKLMKLHPSTESINLFFETILSFVLYMYYGKLMK